jgi:hypothetical protein
LFCNNLAHGSAGSGGCDRDGLADLGRHINTRTFLAILNSVAVHFCLLFFLIKKVTKKSRLAQGAFRREYCSRSDILRGGSIFPTCVGLCFPAAVATELSFVFAYFLSRLWPENAMTPMGKFALVGPAAQLDLLHF